MGLYYQKNCQLDLKWKKMGHHEGRPSDFLDPTGLDYRTVRLQTYAILQDKGGRTLKATQKIIRVAAPSTGPECLVPGDRTIFTLISKRGIKAQWSPGGVSPILTENHGKGGATAERSRWEVPFKLLGEIDTPVAPEDGNVLVGLKDRPWS